MTAIPTRLMYNRSSALSTVGLHDDSLIGFLKESTLYNTARNFGLNTTENDG